MMSAAEILDIIIIIYYGPALLLSLIVVFKHGFNRQDGWIGITLLCIFRLVGSALGISGILHPNNGVIAGSLILSNMGTISLVGGVLGMARRVNVHLSQNALPQRLTRLAQLPTLVALILAIVGGNYAASSDPSTASEGHSLTKAAIILLAIVYLCALALSLYNISLRRYVLDSDRRLVYICLLSLPFILVRLILAFLSAFRYRDPDFSLYSQTNTAIIIRALMGILMEWIVVALFLWAGFSTPRSAERLAQLQAQKEGVPQGPRTRRMGY